jgi:hypothetical protein
MPSCGNCGETGHNRKTCRIPVDAEKLARFEKKRPAKKPKLALAPTTAVKICSMGADGTFEVAVKADADVDALTIVISVERDIARRSIALFVAGDENALAGTQPVVGLMLDAKVTELFMLLRDITDKSILEAIYNANNGENWQETAASGSYTSTGGVRWDSDKPMAEWYGVKTDSDGNVTELDFSNNSDKITCKSL